MWREWEETTVKTHSLPHPIIVFNTKGSGGKISVVNINRCLSRPSWVCVKVEGKGTAVLD